ncbi:MAG: 30S ribosomal protein S17 [Lentisphaeria bacterium]
MNDATKTQFETGARRKVRTGEVVSDRQDKTIVVQVERRAPHPLYKKVVTYRKKYYAHDEDNQCKVGDRVEIEETRPLSKTKHWRLRSVIQRVAE